MPVNRPTGIISSFPKIDVHIDRYLNVYIEFSASLPDSMPVSFVINTL